ncbi:MAG TPA: hypothetical protein PK299_03175 [Anaerolineales bacterium]|nr:hypothetical protein [Anaerolineales bacterium]
MSKWLVRQYLAYPLAGEFVLRRISLPNIPRPVQRNEWWYNTDG